MNRGWSQFLFRALLLLATCLFSTAVLAQQTNKAPKRAGNGFRKSPTPNVILILADDLGWGDVGCYGQEKIKTPNIDRLASMGMRFTQAYAGNTVCAPSRSALMTGKHSGHGRVRSNVQVPLETDDVTLAEVLKSAGLRCGGAGKWALGWEGSTGHPLKQGFEHFFGYLDQVHAHDYYPPWLWLNEGKFTNWKNAQGERLEYAPDWFQLYATNFVQMHEDHPFFLYLPSTLPHANNERGTNGMEVPNYGSYAKTDWPLPEKGKAAMIERLDRLVGATLAQVYKSRVERETVVVFASDNGPHAEGGVSTNFFKSSGPFRGIKRSLYEGGIRVPLIVSWPGRIAAGSTNDLPVAFWDLMPTLAELVGANIPKGIDGVSFAPSLLGREQLVKPICQYWEFHEGGYAQAVRFGDWKAVRGNTNAPVELYRLSDDPGETRDLAEANPEEVAKALKLINESADPFVAPENKSISHPQSP